MVAFSLSDTFLARLSRFAKNEFSPVKLAKIILSLSKDDFCGVVK